MGVGITNYVAMVICLYCRSFFLGGACTEYRIVYAIVRNDSTMVLKLHKFMALCFHSMDIPVACVNSYSMDSPVACVNSMDSPV